MDNKYKNTKIIGITIGDPAGIGPEICIKALLSNKLDKNNLYILFGDASVIDKTLNNLKVSVDRYKVNIVKKCDYLSKFNSLNSINIVDTHNIESEPILGHISSKCGNAAYNYIKVATEWALKKKIDALVTSPINKQSLHEAKIPYIGHTEILAELTSTSHPLTIFETNNLRVFFYTRHLSLKNMLEKIEKNKLIAFAIKCQKALNQLNIYNGTMAIAALNPHAGENDLFGNEESKEIIPAIKYLQKKGYKIDGPIPADSVFYLANKNKYNSVISLYHDQGHIACKTLDFKNTISITANLPFVRTSVDHGTAFDIANKYIADETSMIAAIKAAIKYS